MSSFSNETNQTNTSLSTSPLQINDLFWTLQGEGRWTGQRALFVRLPFCNYDCPWCDTEYNSFKKFTEDEFLIFARQEKARFAVITGGEPMAHKDLARIIMLLKKEGFYIACETNGSLPIPKEIDFPTVSPKRYTKNKYPEFFIHDDAFQKAKEFKYVVDTDFDFSILDRHKRYGVSVRKISEPHQNKDLQDRGAIESAEGIGPSGDIPVRYSLTPEYNKMSEQLPRILDYIQKNPQWQLNLQTHKWIQIA